MTENLDLLQDAVNEGIINIDTVQKLINMKKNEKILKEHPYSIWQSKDGKWRTYLYDETKPRNLRMVKRKLKTDLEKVIINYYEEQKTYEKEKNITMRELYPEWIQYKSLQVNSSGTIARINVDWRRFYCNDEYNKKHGIDIIDTPIKNLTFIQLDSWAHYLVKNGNVFPTFSSMKKNEDKSHLSKKQYFNVSLIIRQLLDYAVNKGIIESNLFLKVKIDTKLYRKIQKKSDQSQVYLVNEEHKIIQLLWDEFYKDKGNTIYLAIILNFCLGLRVGELVALKRSDIEGKYIHVQRQLIRKFDTSDSDDLKFIGYEIVNFTKSNAGDRKIYLVNDAVKIIDILIKTLDSYYSHLPEYKEGFLFLKEGSRHHVIPQDINCVLSKNCKKLNINVKRSHKIRKTVISTLVDSGLNINTIREFAGHEDERTTYNNYTFNRSENKEIENILEQSLSKTF